MEKKYVVPDGMMEAAYGAWKGCDCGRCKRDLEVVVEAVLRYQAEHPPVPSDRDAPKLRGAYEKHATVAPSLAEVATEWMRIAYLAPDPEIPEAVKKLQFDLRYTVNPEQANEAILKAYNLRAGRQG